MLTVITNTNDLQTIAIPPDEMEKLGINDGDEVEFAKNANDEIVLRNAAEAEKKRVFEKAKNTVFEEWNDVFIALAGGVDDKNQQPKQPAGNFVLLQVPSGEFKFVLTAADGRIIFESSFFESQDAARKAVEAMKIEISEIKDEILNFPVKTDLTDVSK